MHHVIQRSAGEGVHRRSRAGLGPDCSEVLGGPQHQARAKQRKQQAEQYACWLQRPVLRCIVHRVEGGAMRADLAGYRWAVEVNTCLLRFRRGPIRPAGQSAEAESQPCSLQGGLGIWAQRFSRATTAGRRLSDRPSSYRERARKREQAPEAPLLRLRRARVVQRRRDEHHDHLRREQRVLPEAQA